MPVMIGELDDQDARELLELFSKSAYELGLAPEQQTVPGAETLLAWCTNVALHQSLLELMRQGKLLIAEPVFPEQEPRFYDAETKERVYLEVRPPSFRLRARNAN